MKGVAFVDKIVFGFSGNHFSHAVLLGDVDGDRARRHTLNMACLFEPITCSGRLYRALPIVLHFS